MRRPALVLVGALLLAAACESGRRGRDLVVTTAHDIRICADGGSAELPLRAGDFLIQIYQGPLSMLDETSIEGVFTSVLTDADAAAGPSHRPEAPVRLSLASGDPLEIGSTEVEVFVDDPNFRRVTVRFLAEVIGRRKDDRALMVFNFDDTFDVINTCPPPADAPTPPQLIVERILGHPVAGFGAFVQPTPTGMPTCNPNPTIPPQVPSDDWTETFEIGSVVAELSQEQLDAAFTGSTPLYPLGTGDHGLTLGAFIPNPMVPGPYLLTWQSVAAPVPLAGDTQFLQYGFVADRDGDPANNYMPQAPFEKDALGGTDTWYLATYDPFSLWGLSVSDVRMFPPQQVASAARAILDGRVLFTVIPVSELGDPASILARWTAFAHTGDFGQVEPWSADATPPVGEPLVAVPLTPNV